MRGWRELEPRSNVGSGLGWARIMDLPSFPIRYPINCTKLTTAFVTCRRLRFEIFAPTVIVSPGAYTCLGKLISQVTWPVRQHKEVNVVRSDMAIGFNNAGSLTAD